MTADIFSSPALPLLLRLEADGFELQAGPDVLRVRPADRLTPELLAELARHKPALLLLVRCCDPGVADRRDVMRAQFDAAPAGRVPALSHARGEHHGASREWRPEGMIRAALILLLLPALASAQERQPLALSTFTGISIDTFAADDLARYLNPEQATGEQVRLSAGLDFGYRLFGSVAQRTERPVSTRQGAGSTPAGATNSLWLVGSTRYGVRSADVDCAADPKLGVCQPFSGRRDAWLYVLRHARTVEASGGLRYEFLSLGGQSDPATLYVSARAGLMAVAGSGDDAADMHRLVGGLLLTGGRHAGSFIEAGIGRSDVYAEPRRVLVDGYFVLHRWRQVTSFVQVSVDADLRPGPDSLQTHVGAAVDLD